MGLEVLTGFSAGPHGPWRGETLYTPRKGTSYPATLASATDGRLQITVKDGFLSKTVYWTHAVD